MPLKPGSSRKVISSNISELTHHGTRPRSHAQIVAIALHEADKYRADGGSTPSNLADASPFHPGGYVQSDVPGRTDRIPMRVPADSFVIPADVVSALGQGNPTAGAKLLDDMLGKPQQRAEGGDTSDVIVAGAEYVVPAETVTQLGGGSNPKGQALLRNMVDKIRREEIKRLRTAPKPKK